MIIKLENENGMTLNTEKKYVEENITIVLGEKILSRERLVEIIGLATEQLDGLLSSQDKKNLNVLVSMLQDKDNNYVDAIQEILEIFKSYPEQVDLIDLIASKVDKEEFENYKNDINNQFIEINSKVDEEIEKPDIYTFDNYETMCQVLYYSENSKYSIGDILLIDNNPAYWIKNIRLEKEEPTGYFEITEVNSLTDPIFNTTKKVSVSVGGVQVGEDLNGLSFGEIVEKLLYPYVASKISYVSPDLDKDTIYEKGETKQLNQIDVGTILYSEPQCILYLYDENELLQTKVSSGGTTVFSSLNLSFNDNKKFYVGITDEGSSTITKTPISYKFVDGMFYGVTDTNNKPVNSTILSSTKIIENKKNKIISFTCDEKHPFFAYPSSYGLLTSILDPNNFENIDDFELYTTNLVVKSGIVNYNVYVKKTSAVLNRFAYNFIF